MKLKHVIIILFCFNLRTLVAQETNRVQPTVMVVPFTSKGEDLRAKIESDFAYRAAFNTVKKAFEDRGYTTIDFVEALKSSSINQTANKGITQTDLWKEIQENATADIFVYTEVFVYKSTSGNKVQILLSAVDKYSAQQLASSELLSSNLMYTEDYATLAKQALTRDDAIGTFLNALNRKFADISVNGKSVEVRIELNNDSQINFNDEVGTDYDLLADLITDWMKKNAFKNDCHIKSKGDKLIWFDHVKIPIKNEDGTNYYPDDFARTLYKFLKKLGPQVKTGKMDLDLKPIVGSKIQINIK